MAATTRAKREDTMETIFYSLQDFMLCTKSMTYILMGLGVLGLFGFWLFLTGRDKPIRKY